MEEFDLSAHGLPAKLLDSLLCYEAGPCGKAGNRIKTDHRDAINLAKPTINKRHRTTTLFAALNVLDGTAVGRNIQRHRHQNFIRFLGEIERSVPAGKTFHVVLDNYAAHEHEKVRAWLVRHPRWTFHFTPTSSRNAVEASLPS